MGVNKFGSSKKITSQLTKSEMRRYVLNRTLPRNAKGQLKVQNVADPEEDGDVISKQYFDRHLQSKSLALDGSNKPVADIDWNEKRIKNTGTAIELNDVITKEYVDNAAKIIGENLQSKSLALDGSNTPKTDINWNGKRLMNLGRPIEADDAATVHYVNQQRHQLVITDRYRGKNGGWFHFGGAGVLIVKQCKLVRFGVATKSRTSSVKIHLNVNGVVQTEVFVEKEAGHHFHVAEYNNTHFVVGDRITLTTDHLKGGDTITLYFEC